MVGQKLRTQVDLELTFAGEYGLVGKDLFVFPMSCIALAPQEGCASSDLALTENSKPCFVKPV